MIRFRETMDPHALDVDRINPAKDGVVDGSATRVASIQCHHERQARLVTTTSNKFFTLDELEHIVTTLKQKRRGD